MIFSFYENDKISLKKKNNFSIVRSFKLSSKVVEFEIETNLTEQYRSTEHSKYQSRTVKQTIKNASWNKREERNFSFFKLKFPNWTRSS